MLADRDKVSFYLKHMLKSTDYSFYLKPDCFYYIEYVSSLGLYSLRGYYSNGIPNIAYRFQYIDGLIKTLRGSQMYNLIGSKCIVANLQDYYVVSQNKLLSLDSYIKNQYLRLNLDLNMHEVYAKGNLIYIPVLSTGSYCVINTQNDNVRFIEHLPNDYVRLY